MTKQPKTDLVWDGKARWWPRNDYGLGERDSNLWMCAEDLGLGIWAHFHRLQGRYGRLDPEPLRLEDCSDELRGILENCLPYHDHGEGLSDAVTDFARIVGQQLVTDGRMPFEVSGGWDESGSTRHLEKARLTYVYPDSMVRIGTTLYQVAPGGGAEETTDSPVVRLDRGRIATFEPPRRYRRSMARIRTGLPALGRSKLEWMTGATSDKHPEDFTSVNRSYCVRQARLSAPIGWSGRGSWRDHMADFHSMSREFQWQRFCIEVRDGILETLATIFQMIGAWRDERPRLVWDHLPTVEEVNEAESQIMTNGARFEEVLKPFRLGTSASTD